MVGGLPSELPGMAPLECGEFQRPESLCADRNELGSQSPEFPWQEEDSEDDEEEEGEDTDLDAWEPDPPRPFEPHDLCE